MAATSTVLYPQGVKFDMKYYIDSHMPLVQKEWGTHGLTSWKVLEFPDDAPYKVQATLEWKSIESFKTAVADSSAKTVFGDVPNFSDKQPTVLSGPVIKAT